MAQVGDYDFYPTVAKLVKEGKLKVREQISTDLGATGQLLYDSLQSGGLTGKPIINLATH